MKTLKLFAAAVAAAGLLAVPAHASTVFMFKSGAGPIDTPTGNFVFDCGSVGSDYCTDDDAAGFTYSKDGVTFTAVGLASGSPATLVQDIIPENSGLGVFSAGESQTGPEDQVQASAGESIKFTFTSNVNLTNVEFNSGADRDCSAASQPEGPCGFFDLYVDGGLVGTFEAVDLFTLAFFGSVFEFVAITAGGGFAIAQFEISDVPVPPVLPLLLAGLAGLGFASRRRKTA